MKISTDITRTDEARWDDPLVWDRPDRTTVLIYGLRRTRVTVLGEPEPQETWRMLIRRRFKNGSLTVIKAEIIDPQQETRLPEMLRWRIGQAKVRWDEIRLAEV